MVVPDEPEVSERAGLLLKGKCVDFDHAEVFQCMQDFDSTFSDKPGLCRMLTMKSDVGDAAPTRQYPY